MNQCCGILQGQLRCHFKRFTDGGFKSEAAQGNPASWGREGLIPMPFSPNLNSLLNCCCPEEKIIWVHTGVFSPTGEVAALGGWGGERDRIQFKSGKRQRERGLILLAHPQHMALM